jgi:peptide/nickel transport system permease protein
MKSFLRSFSEIRKYPSAVVGLTISFLLIVLAVYTVIKIPYSEAIRLWRAGEGVWATSPRLASPKWVNWFSKEKQSETIVLSSMNEEGGADEGVIKEYTTTSSGKTDVRMSLSFDYNADEFPQEVLLYFNSEFVDKEPFASITWDTPDGRNIRVGDLAIRSKDTYRISQDDALVRRLGGLQPHIGLFADPESPDPENPQVLKGTYTINVSVLLFEETGDANAEFVSFGTVSGWFGTDHLRRDLMVPLMWGAPIALIFGLLASGGVSLITMAISAVGGWYGGVVDAIIQRITEVNLTLPFLSILIMIGTFYSRSIWLMLGAVIVLNIFGASIKTYRAIFLQIRESTYIEAAKAYGASDARIIFRYLIPRIVPLLIPGLVIGIPGYVFLEASLAVLGLGDPVLPTWGKIINDAWVNAALYNGHYYWIIQPAILLMITGLAFAMLGYSLDRIFNPRLRGL